MNGHFLKYLKKKVQLINARLSKEFYPSIRAGAYPPLNLISLATYIQIHCPYIKVEIIDGEIVSLEEIINRLEDCLVAISCNSLTYEPALQIAEIAKSRKAFVILGGVHPTFTGSHIIYNRSYVDTVVCGDGEISLLRLIKGCEFSYIPNLIYRKNGTVLKSEKIQISLDSLPSPNYNFIKLEPYFLNYRRLYSDKPFQKPFASYSAKGCLWRAQPGGGCIFCGIQDKHFRIKSVSQYWSELMHIHDVWKADFFWDVADTFTMDKNWVRKFAINKPGGADFQFQVYGRSSDIDEEMAYFLARIGVYEVFLGIESGNNELLKKSGKGINMRTNLRAIKNLNREGIKVIFSVMLGLPGETDNTLMSTCEMVEDILSWANISEFNCNILLPLPGSKAISLLYPYLNSENGKEDLFNYEALKISWINCFCETSYEKIIETQLYLINLHHRVGTFGQSVLERAI